MKYMKKIFFLTIAVFLSVSVFAQEVKPHEFMVGGGGGISTLRYDNSSLGFGGNVNLGYAYNFNQRWAILSGLELDFYSAKSRLSSFADTYTIHVAAYAPLGDDRFDYTADVQGFSEKQKAMYLTIPILARYKYVLGGANKSSIENHQSSIYFMGGLKLGLPLGSSYSGGIDQFTTSGYSYFTRQPHAGEPEYGFSTYNNQDLNGDLNLKLSVALSLEAGYEWPLRENLRLYSGVYFDYGLNNISSEKNSHVVSYNPADMPSPKLSSATTVSDKVNIMAAGVMLRLAFNVEKPQPKSRIGKSEQVQPEVLRYQAVRDSAREAQEKEVQAKREKARQDSVAQAQKAEAARLQAQQDSIAQVEVVPMAQLSGVVKDLKTGQPVAAVVELTNNSTGEMQQRASTDSLTGEYALQLPLGADYGMAVKSDSYLFHSENIDLSKEKKPLELKRNVAIEKIEQGAKIALRNTFFETAKSDLTKESATELQNVVALLAQNPTMRIEISGHTDNVGAAAYNKRLSDARAKSVMDYLISQGVSADRLTHVGYGFDQPVATNQTPEGRALNRRTEIKIIGN